VLFGGTLAIGHDQNLTTWPVDAISPLNSRRTRRFPAWTRVVRRVLLAWAPAVSRSPWQWRGLRPVRAVHANACDLFHAAGGQHHWPSAAVSVTTKRSALTVFAMAASGVAPPPWQQGMSGDPDRLHVPVALANANIGRQRRHSFRSIQPLPWRITRCTGFCSPWPGTTTRLGLSEQTGNGARESRLLSSHPGDSPHVAC
jgi:hypothetical protein